MAHGFRVLGQISHRANGETDLVILMLFIWTLTFAGCLNLFRRQAKFDQDNNAIVFTSQAFNLL
jgi:hypothetical protein